MQSVHVYEKWFFISEEVLRLYIAPGEVVPTRRVQNKEHMIQVMFLAAVACPRYDLRANAHLMVRLARFRLLRELQRKEPARIARKEQLKQKFYR